MNFPAVNVRLGHDVSRISREPSVTVSGTITVEFTVCNAGIIIYDIPSIGRQGVIAIERIVLENLARCEALNRESQRAQMHE